MYTYHTHGWHTGGPQALPWEVGLQVPGFARRFLLILGDLGEA